MRYEIEFFDYWHLGSGTSAGAMMDSVVAKENGLFPYLSGKTIKGLLREMVEEIESNRVTSIFGSKGSDISPNYFSNATLNNATKKYLLKNRHLVKHLFSSISSTKIEKNGIAKDTYLRSIEVVVPLRLYGEIKCIDNDTEVLLEKAMKMIKQIGMNRNRGFGRCQIIRSKND